MEVYVAGHANESVGGLDWRLTEAEAREALELWVRAGEADGKPMDTRLTVVSVPDDLPQEEVANWIYAQPFLWEPAYGERA